MIWPLTLLKPRTPLQLLDEDLAEAQRLYLLHSGNAEHHAALARMYAERIPRLKALKGEAPAEPVKPAKKADKVETNLLLAV